jgi:hypothetical protein
MVCTNTNGRNPLVALHGKELAANLAALVAKNDRLLPAGPHNQQQEPAPTIPHFLHFS